MKSKFIRIAGALLVSLLVVLSTGCGGGFSSDNSQAQEFAPVLFKKKTSLDTLTQAQ